MKSEFIGFSYDCCKKCTDDRYPGCHGSCEKYLKIKAKNDELKEARKLDNDKRYILSFYGEYFNLDMIQNLISTITIKR